MINGFDEETAPLSENELEILPSVVSILQTRKGCDFAITNKQIVKSIWINEFKKIGEARIRKIINHIRMNGCVSCLVASSKGYYIASNEQELLDYEKSLEGRIIAISAIKGQIKKQREEKYHQVQGTLF